MTIVVFGGTSQIGRFLLPCLIARGESVLAFSRQPHAPQAGVEWLQGHVADAPLPSIKVSAVICMGPLVGFDDWLARNDLSSRPRVIAISSMSAQSKLDSELRHERELAQSLRDAEAKLARICERHGSAWTIFRPTLIYGVGMDKSLTPIARRAMRTRVFPLFGGKGLRQPVHAQDIALAILAALDHREASGYVLPMGGGERLSVHEMFVRVRASLPVFTLPLPVPMPVLRVARYFLKQMRGVVARFQVDLTADNRELERRLGVKPRGFQPGPDTWRE